MSLSLLLCSGSNITKRLGCLKSKSDRFPFQILANRTIQDFGLPTLTISSVFSLRCTTTITRCTFNSTSNNSSSSDICTT